MYFRIREKKLEEIVGKIYGKQNVISAAVLDDMKAFNATPESVIEAEQKIHDASVVEVLPENRVAVEIFIGCKIERTVTPTGASIFEGIRRETIPVVSAMLGFGEVERETFFIIRVLESLAVEELNRGA